MHTVSVQSHRMQANGVQSAVEATSFSLISLHYEMEAININKYDCQCLNTVIHVKIKRKP